GGLRAPRLGDPGRESVDLAAVSPLADSVHGHLAAVEGRQSGGRRVSVDNNRRISHDLVVPFLHSGTSTAPGAGHRDLPRAYLQPPPTRPLRGGQRAGPDEQGG